MSDRDIQEINEIIRNLREQLAGPLMSAEKEYKIRFEISDLQYESLQHQIDDLKAGLKSQRTPNYRSEGSDQISSDLDRESKEIQKRIERIEMDQQTRVMNTDKERELIDQLKRLKDKLKEIESQKSRNNPSESRVPKSLHPEREINNIQKRIQILEMDQQTRVMNTDKERELIDEILLLKRKIREIESQKTWNGNSKGIFTNDRSTPWNL